MFRQAASFTTKIGKIVDLSKCFRSASFMFYHPKVVTFGELHQYYDIYIKKIDSTSKCFSSRTQEMASWASGTQHATT